MNIMEINISIPGISNGRQLLGLIFLGKILDEMVKKLSKYYYVPEPKVLDAQDFGLAQRRKRIFIVGFLNFNILCKSEVT